MSEAEFSRNSNLNSTDRELLEKSRAYLMARLGGDNVDAITLEAWENFYLIYCPLIRRFAASCHVPVTDFDDCIQEVWTSVATELVRFQYDRARGRFRAWLYAIVRSKATDLIRRRRRATAREVSVEVTNIVSRELDPSRALEKVWRLELVRAAVDELSRQVSGASGEIVRMKWFEHRKMSDIAAHLGLSERQVRFRHHRLKQKLRRILAHYTGEDLPLAG